MKIGTKVRNEKVRPNDIATVESSKLVLVKYKDGREEPRTSYTAKYEDGSGFIFYGSQIGNVIKIVEEFNGQMVMNLEKEKDK